MAVSFQPGYPLQVRDPLLHDFPQDRGFPVNVLKPTPQMDETQKKFCKMENKLSYNLWVTISCLPTMVNLNGIVYRCFDKEVIYVCNPLTYASLPHNGYIQQYCSPKHVLFVGMNPGRNGMAQNGIPFGDPDHVANFLKIMINNNLPPGLQCEKKEESGHRFWELMKEKYGTAEDFFQYCFVYNYCPLLFLDKDDNNIPLKDIPANYRGKMEDDCDKALWKCIRIIMPKIIVGVGGYAEGRIMHVLKQNRSNIRCEKIRHPVARGLLSAEDWKRFAGLKLREYDIPEPEPEPFE